MLISPRFSSPSIEANFGPSIQSAQAFQSKPVGTSRTEAPPAFAQAIRSGQVRRIVLHDSVGRLAAIHPTTNRNEAAGQKKCPQCTVVVVPTQIMIRRLFLSTVGLAVGASFGIDGPSELSSKFRADLKDELKIPWQQQELLPGSSAQQLAAELCGNSTRHSPEHQSNHPLKRHWLHGSHQQGPESPGAYPSRFVRSNAWRREKGEHFL